MERTLLFTDMSCTDMTDVASVHRKRIGGVQSEKSVISRRLAAQKHTLSCGRPSCYQADMGIAIAPMSLLVAVSYWGTCGYLRNSVWDRNSMMSTS